MKHLFFIFLNNFVRLYCDSCHISAHLKNLSKLVNFCKAILILKMKENTQYFWSIMLYNFKKGKNATEIQKKMCSIWRRCCDGLNVSEVVCEVLCWRFIARQCSMVRLTSWGWKQSSWDFDWEQSTFYMQEIADILKISKLIKLLVKVKNVSFILWKTKWTLWPTQY